MKSLVFLCVVMLFAGCNSGKKTMNIDKSLQLISKGSLHGAGEEGITAQKTVITSENEWNALKEKMNSVNPVSENFQHTEIDFSKEVVIAIFESVKRSGGHSVSVAGINETKEKTEIQVKRTAPDGMATTVIEQPYYLAKMEKPSKPVVFREM